jgi:hypothetical protein
MSNINKNSSYVLFYKESDEIINFLICKSYMGHEINGDRGSRTQDRIFCKSVSKVAKSPITINKDIADIKKAIIEKRNYKHITSDEQLIVKKFSDSSLHIVSDSTAFNNLLGGEMNNLENPEDALIRELSEELFINVDPLTLTEYLANIKSQMTEFCESIERKRDFVHTRRIYLINIASLNESVRKYINDVVSNSSLLHKRGIHCGILDVELGELQCIYWVNCDDLQHMLVSAMIKFNYNNVLISMLENKRLLVATSAHSEFSKGGAYYEKYLKYKTKYLELKSRIN